MSSYFRFVLPSRSFTSNAAVSTRIASWTPKKKRHRLLQAMYCPMRPWLTHANHASTLRRMEQYQEDASTKTRATIPLTPVLSVLRRQLTGVGETLDLL